MKLLIVDEMHDSITSLMEELGFKVDYFKDFDYADSLAVIENYDGLLIRSKFYIDDAFLAKAVNLKFIGRAGAGLDLIDLIACKTRGIEVFAANAANKVAVAEQLLGMILALFHNVIKSNIEVKNNIWDREGNRGEELYGKTIGIIGYGHNGSESAARFAAFGCKVLVYDKYKSGFGYGSIIETNLEQIFEEADVLSLHIPLSHETKGLVNHAFFNQFKKQIYFCNVARGEIMVQDDLVKVLESGKVKGMVLDVLENEKISKLTEEQTKSFNYLKNHPRVLLTPHVAGWTFESYEKINIVLRNQIADYKKRASI